MRTIAVVAMLLPSLCAAQEFPEPIRLTGLYAGLALGESKLKTWCDGVPRVTSTSLVSCDDSDDYFKGYLGYEILPMLSVEAGFHSLGSATIEVTDLSSSAKLEAKGEAATLRAVLNGHLDQLFVFAAAGVARWDAKISLKDGTLVLATIRDSGYSLHWAVGGGIEINKWWAVRAEYEVFKDVGEDATTGQLDVKSISLGLQYRF